MLLNGVGVLGPLILATELLIEILNLCRGFEAFTSMCLRCERKWSGLCR